MWHKLAWQRLFLSCLFTSPLQYMTLGVEKPRKCNSISDYGQKLELWRTDRFREWWTLGCWLCVSADLQVCFHTWKPTIGSIFKIHHEWSLPHLYRSSCWRFPSCLKSFSLPRYNLERNCFHIILQGGTWNLVCPIWLKLQLSWCWTSR